METGQLQEKFIQMKEEMALLKEELTHRNQEDMVRLDGELTTLKKNCDHLSEQVVGLEGEVATLKGDNATLKGEVTTLKGDNATLKGDNATLRQEVVHLREEVVRLRQAVLEERTTRQVVVEELRQEVRRRAAPSDRSQSDGEEVVSLKADTCDKCDATTSCDVTPTTEEAGPASGERRPPAACGTNIYHLDYKLLKMVLSKMDCWDMFRARRVCHRWRSAVDDIVGDCRRELTDRQTRGGEVPAPATSLELVLKAQDQPKLTELRAPTAETDTDLRLVAATCHALEKANLRGFKLRVSALRRLARANASSLCELTLPAGINDWQLEALLEPLKALERLDVSPPVDSSGKWLRLLPKSLKRLDITGSGMTGAPLTFNRCPSEGVLVGVLSATDTLLDQLAVLATHTVTKLFIREMEPRQLQEEVIQMKEEMALLKEELTHRHQEGIARLDVELTTLKKNCDSLSEQVVGLEGEVATLKGDNATLKGDNATLKGDNTTLRQEVVHLREEVVRLRQAVLEERTTRQVVVEELRQEVRRRAAPSDRLQSDDEEPRELNSLKDNNCDKCDVTTQTAEDAGLAGDSLRPPAPHETNIYHLDTELLKMVLSKMDCRDMFRARR
ncbi:uncharacterized protein LOC122393457, partial [Amphibalanus amphitrite]|uniref:uncharacterized protein LOC122393457 n=1 Tax=Amphibalanus amphitrite TaxID=1232801 RepID=UPI001C921B25